MTHDPVRQADIERRLANTHRSPVQAGRCEGEAEVPDARRNERLRRASR